MKILNKKCGIVWGAALAATAIATTAFLCPASATASTVEGPFFGKRGISYTAGPFDELSVSHPSRWPNVRARHLYLAPQAKDQAEKRTDGPWKGYHLWDAEDLYGAAGTGLIAVPNSSAKLGGSDDAKGCSGCTMVGVRSKEGGGETHDLLEAVMFGFANSASSKPATGGKPLRGDRATLSGQARNSASGNGGTDRGSKADAGAGAGYISEDLKPKNVVIHSGLSVTIQQHFYEFELRPSRSRYRDKDKSQYVALTETAPQGKRDNLLGLLPELGVALNDWRKPFAERNGSGASNVAASDLSASFMKNGAEASNDFYSGKMGVYDVTLEATSSADTDKNVPFGKHASLTLTVMVGNPREAARKEIWDKLQLVKQKVGDKSDLPTLSDEERKTLVGEADNAAEKAHDAVKEATVKAIETELSKGLKALDAVVTKAELTNAKHIASQRVKDAQKKAEEAIVRLEDLGESERNAHVKEIDAKATSALEAISRATSSAEAHKHADEGVKDINNLLLFILKVWGKATILVYGGENGPARKNLNALLKPGGGLTQLQIDEYVKRIQAVVDAATRNGGSMDLATSVDGVLEAVKHAKSDIDGIVAEAQQASRDALKRLERAKAEAEVELRRIADAAKGKVSKIADVGQGEKDASNDKIEAALQTALTAVGQSDTVDDVRKALTDGRNAIEKILMDLENLAKKHGKPATDKPAKDKPAADKGKPTADRPAALAATGVAVTDMALFVALLAMLAAVGAAVTRRRR